MRRRAFIAVLGGAAAWPLVTRAQQSLPVVGYVNGASATVFKDLVAAFRQGLSGAGYIEGQNVTVEYRWAEGHYDRLPAMVSELVRRHVDVMVANTPAVVSAMVATTTIPIVFITGSDPVEAGFVTNLGRPERNVTGVYFFAAQMEAKRLGLLRELVPTAVMIAVLLNPAYPNAETQAKEVQEGARALGVQIQVLRAGTEQELDTAFSASVQLRAGALLVCADSFFNSRRNQIVALAASHAMPTIYQERTFAEAGGLASYGTSLIDAYRQAGIYAVRILRGEKPVELPVLQSTKFEFVINFKTAKTLGLEISPQLLARADEIIE